VAIGGVIGSFMVFMVLRSVEEVAMSVGGRGGPFLFKYAPRWEEGFVLARKEASRVFIKLSLGVP
jgi:hypothetical protein